MPSAPPPPPQPFQQPPEQQPVSHLSPRTPAPRTPKRLIFYNDGPASNLRPRRGLGEVAGGTALNGRREDGLGVPKDGGIGIGETRMKSAWMVGSRKGNDNNNENAIDDDRINTSNQISKTTTTYSSKDLPSRFPMINSVDREDDQSDLDSHSDSDRDSGVIPSSPSIPISPSPSPRTLPSNSSSTTTSTFSPVTPKSSKRSTSSSSSTVATPNDPFLPTQNHKDQVRPDIDIALPTTPASDSDEDLILVIDPDPTTTLNSLNEPVSTLGSGCTKTSDSIVENSDSIVIVHSRSELGINSGSDQEEQVASLHRRLRLNLPDKVRGEYEIAVDGNPDDELERDQTMERVERDPQVGETNQTDRQDRVEKDDHAEESVEKALDDLDRDARGSKLIVDLILRLVLEVIVRRAREKMTRQGDERGSGVGTGSDPSSDRMAAGKVVQKYVDVGVSPVTLSRTWRKNSTGSAVEFDTNSPNAQKTTHQSVLALQPNRTTSYETHNLTATPTHYTQLLRPLAHAVGHLILFLSTLIGHLPGWTIVFFWMVVVRKTSGWIGLIRFGVWVGWSFWKWI